MIDSAVLPAPVLAETLALAFDADPVFRWWIPDDDRRREIVPAFFELVTQGSDVVEATGDGAAVAVWNRPGAEDDEAMGAAIMAIAGEHTDRLLQILGLMAEQHPPEPHWYLWFLGTRPDRQSQGLGSAVMRRVLDACDAGGTPAYLEATSQRGVALYERHGFEVSGEIRLPGGPSLWPMWRPSA